MFACLSDFLLFSFVFFKEKAAKRFVAFFNFPCCFAENAFERIE